jgi:hypothetical protein
MAAATLAALGGSHITLDMSVPEPAAVRNKHSGYRKTENGIYRCGAVDRNKYDRPHCGKRQQARYARQLAAGEISFIHHGRRAA